MTEHAELVESVRRLRAVEEWGEQVNYLLAQNGYLEISKNNGLTTRTYNRDSGAFKEGDVEIISPAKSITELDREAPGNV